MKFFTKTFLSLIVLCLAGFSAKAIGWPANYEGVMLQGFGWNTYTDTKWTNLEAQADELSQSFKLIWIPNSAKASGDPNMGYMPIYWFTNHNSSFGTEAELISMINTFKAKGTGMIADVVINHRVGVTDWADFPTETWNGQTWKIGPEGICRTDEWGQGTGANDTGDDFSAARDLDHTNANVQNNCRNYVLCLKDKYGYAGMRYDMVKGYGGQYTKMYNQYANVEFSVGEYWDSNYDAVAAWIEATGKTSAAFDFPGKYQINKAFANNDMRELVWKANGTTDQPAGMIHFGYSQYAVTFVDNHDTYRDGSKFTGNVEAANAFIICSPGTPCVFLPHWQQYKSAIKKMIAVRNAVGVHNNSAVKVLQSSTDCYMAEVTGSKGKLVVKVGSAMASPSGYSDSDIKASGNGWCIWSKSEVGGGDDPDPDPIPAGTPSSLYIMGNLEQGSWMTNVGVSMTKSGDKFTAKNVKLVATSGEENAFFTFVTALGTTGASSEWDAVINASNRYGAASKDLIVTVGSSSAIETFVAGVNASSAYSWGIAPGTYDITADFSTKTMTITGQGTIVDPDPDPTPDPDPDPTTWTVYYDNSVTNWSVINCYSYANNAANNGAWPGKAMTKVEGDIYSITVPAGSSLVFNNGSKQTLDIAPAKDKHVYKGLAETAANSGGTTCNKVSDMGEYNGGDNPNPDPDPTPDPDVKMPSQLYILGDIEDNAWNTAAGLEMTKSGDTFVAKSVKFASVDPTATKVYFNLTDALGADWDELNQVANRYGAPEEGVALSTGVASEMKAYLNNVDAMGCLSWSMAPGTYDVVADFKNMTITITGQGTIVDPDPDPTPDPENWTVYYDNSVTNWSVINCYSYANDTANNGAWPGKAMTKVEGDIYSITVPAGSSLVFNNGSKQTLDIAPAKDKHVYKGLAETAANSGGTTCNKVSDMGEYNGGDNPNPDPDPTPDPDVKMPAQLYILGDIEDNAWNTAAGLEMTKSGDTFVAKSVKFASVDPTATKVYFNLTDALGADWDELNQVANRYGAPEEGVALSTGVASEMKAYLNNVDAMGCLSWSMAPGTYDVVADFKNMTVTIKSPSSGVDSIIASDEEVAPVYYNLQGVEVENPSAGLYIVVRGNKVTKEIVR